MKNIKLNGEGLSRTTQKVVSDFNKLSDKAFFWKYSGSKNTYLKRFIKYGDPYMNAPLARIGKRLTRFLK